MEQHVRAACVYTTKTTISNVETTINLGPSPSCVYLSFCSALLYNFYNALSRWPRWQLHGVNQRRRFSYHYRQFVYYAKRSRTSTLFVWLSSCAPFFLIDVKNKDFFSWCLVVDFDSWIIFFFSRRRHRYRCTSPLSFLHYSSSIY